MLLSIPRLTCLCVLMRWWFKKTGRLVGHLLLFFFFSFFFGSQSMQSQDEIVIKSARFLGGLLAALPAHSLIGMKRTEPPVGQSVRFLIRTAKTITEKATIERLPMTCNPGHSRPVSLFKALYFCIVVYGKKKKKCCFGQCSYFCCSNSSGHWETC